MVACISPEMKDASETQTTLLYAGSAAKMRNFPRVNTWAQKMDVSRYAFLERRVVEVERQLEVLPTQAIDFSHTMLHILLIRKWTQCTTTTVLRCFV